MSKVDQCLPLCHLSRILFTYQNCPYLKKDIYHLERMQRAARRWVKSLRDPYYEDRVKELKLKSLEKRRIRNDLVLTYKTKYNQIDRETSQLFKFSRRQGLRRPSALHAELLNTGTVYHLRQHRCRIIYLSKDNQVLLLTLDLALKSIFAPIWSFLDNLSFPDH